MGDVQYKYARLESGALCPISAVNKDNRYDHKYYCISCGGELKPRIGRKNAHHFYHVDPDCPCSGETYLHKLAKIKLKEKFDNTEQFLVSFRRKMKCSEFAGCDFSSYGCITDVIEEFDLKEHYTECEIEAKIDYDGQIYRADLMLSRGVENDSGSLLIEIWVKHKSTDCKLKSGLRVIELRVASEEDIERYCNGGIIESIDYLEKERKVSFYGFNRSSRKIGETNSRLLFRFVLYRSGSAYVCPIECKNKNWLLEPDSLIEFNLIDNNDGDLYVPCLLMTREYGISLKNCLLCKYYKGEEYMESFCAMSKNYGTPKHPKQYEASSCRYYREDKDRLSRERERINTMIITRVIKPPYDDYR